MMKPTNLEIPDTVVEGFSGLIASLFAGVCKNPYLYLFLFISPCFLDVFIGFLCVSLD